MKDMSHAKRFENSLEHLMAELERVDLRIRLRVWRNRQRNAQADDDEFRGLYISEEEIDALMGEPALVQDGDDIQIAADDPSSASLRRLENQIALKKSQSLADGIPLRLCELADDFGLNPFEVDTLLICLLPEIDTKYERLYAYLHDDVTRKRSTVNLVLECLLDQLDDRMAGRSAFEPQAPLIAEQLVRLDDDVSSRSSSLLAKNLRIESRIANYLLGSDQIDPALSAYANWVMPSLGMENLVLSDSLTLQLSRLASTLKHDSISPLLYIQGPYGIGKKTIAEVLCRDIDSLLLMVDVAGILGGDLPVQQAIMLAFREAKLQRAAICLDRLDLLVSEDRALTARLGDVIGRIGHFHGPVFATGEATWQPGSALGERGFARIIVDFPSYDERRRLWDVFLNGRCATALAEDLDEIADKFRFTPRQIKDAAVTACNLSSLRSEDQLSTIDLYSACRAMSNQKLNLLARKIAPKYRWEDIVLPQDQMAQLRETTNYVKYRHIVFGQWSFDRKLSLGKGLNVLFAGPSGTGKTMAAEIIANELGLDLYKIDLSTVISKYIGETEKNLDRIFTEAQNSNSILFFDEADAVFGKRSEVKDSHDRYANIEVAYLLQKMEEYDGIVILATNLRKNLDEAFARRMHFSVEFPQPEEPDRRLIWQGVFPQEAPLSENVDLNFMARQFKITGGNVKNIALGSAFLAASDGGIIQMEHLIRSAKREYQKIGRLCTETDFGPYFKWVRG